MVIYNILTLEKKARQKTPRVSRLTKDNGIFYDGVTEQNTHAVRWRRSNSGTIVNKTDSKLKFKPQKKTENKHTDCYRRSWPTAKHLWWIFERTERNDDLTLWNGKLSSSGHRSPLRDYFERHPGPSWRLVEPQRSVLTGLGGGNGSDVAAGASTEDWRGESPSHLQPLSTEAPPSFQLCFLRYPRKEQLQSEDGPFPPF